MSVNLHQSNFALSLTRAQSRKRARRDDWALIRATQIYA